MCVSLWTSAGRCSTAAIVVAALLGGGQTVLAQDPDPARPGGEAGYGLFPGRRASEQRAGRGGEDGLFPARRTGGEGGGGGGGGSAPGGSNGGAEALPAPFDAPAEAVNPGRYHRILDEALGRETEWSDKPRAPEIPLSVFVESVRPLGSLKYDNQTNYFVGAFTGNAPTLQTVSFEYVFADWNAARAEVIAPGGKVESLGFGYQRTFGVGPNHNWVHGGLILPEVAVTGSGFVGGSAFYTVAWKPEGKSPWTVGASAGANRASFANRPIGGAEGGVGSMAMNRPELGRANGPAGGEEEARVWRPFTALNLWYTLSPQFTVGTEMDAYPHQRFGEYLVLPHVVWRPVKHFFVQCGAGWYDIGGQGQATFMCRANLLNPSPRKNRDAAGGDAAR